MHFSLQFHNQCDGFIAFTLKFVGRVNGVQSECELSRNGCERVRSSSYCSLFVQLIDWLWLWYVHMPYIIWDDAVRRDSRVTHSGINSETGRHTSARSSISSSANEKMREMSKEKIQLNVNSVAFLFHFLSAFVERISLFSLTKNTLFLCVLRRRTRLFAQNWHVYERPYEFGQHIWSTHRHEFHG